MQRGQHVQSVLRFFGSEFAGFLVPIAGQSNIGRDAVRPKDRQHDRIIGGGERKRSARVTGFGRSLQQNSRGRDIALKQTMDTRLLPLILGRDATQISKIKHSLEFQLHNFGRISGVEYGIAAIDIALWDLLGKACGQPLYRLLGGAYADELEVYASLMRYGNVDDVVKATRRALDRGYRYIKLHEIGLDEIRAAVKACAGKAKVMIDVNCPWTVPEALAIAKELQDLDLYWFEEPVWPPENYLGLARVRQQGLHRIAAGENAGSLHDFMSMISAGAISRPR